MDLIETDGMDGTVDARDSKEAYEIRGGGDDV